jgi:hypothetical protein
MLLAGLRWVSVAQPRSARSYDRQFRLSPRICQTCGMATARGSYVRRSGIEIRKEDKHGDPEYRLNSRVEAAIDKWLTENAKRRKSGPPAPRQWHRPWQPKIKEPLAVLLAKADRPEPEPLDCSGWESQIYDGDREGVLALE